MNAPSFLKRLVGSVLPSERRRSSRRARNAIQLCHALTLQRGQGASALIARDALAAYNALPKSALPAFFDAIAADFAPDREALERAYNAYRAEPTQDHLIHLQRCVEAPRQALFRRLQAAPGGPAALVAMRGEVLAAMAAHPEWKGIDADLQHLFGSWLNGSCLTLERIDWYTPAIVLEKLIEYETVHEIAGWHDLRRRLAADRRCFAFFHAALPNEPLIFIEVAFTRGTDAGGEPLLTPDAPELEPQAADTAIFHSITHCQAGLRGIAFGHLLMKQVGERLAREFPRLKTFATRSPIPGFRAWLRASRNELEQSPAGAIHRAAISEIETPDWHRNAIRAEALSKLLLPLAAHYLALEKRKGEAADAVARFHLSNGARLERLNWLADTSARGLQQSAGITVNYVYRLDEVESNHESYVREEKVAASREIRELAAESARVRELT